MSSTTMRASSSSSLIVVRYIASTHRADGDFVVDDYMNELATRRRDTSPRLTTTTTPRWSISSWTRRSRARRASRRYASSLRSRRVQVCGVVWSDIYSVLRIFTTTLFLILMTPTTTWIETRARTVCVINNGSLCVALCSIASRFGLKARRLSQNDPVLSSRVYYYPLFSLSSRSLKYFSPAPIT